MQEVSIKRLGLFDLYDAKLLFLQFQREDGISFPKVATEGRISQLLEDDHFIVLAAYHGSHLLGGLTAYVLDLYKNNGHKIILYEIGVPSTKRRKGIGRKLMEDLKARSRELGATELLIPASLSNSDA